MTEFSSSFSEHCVQFLDYRTARGYKRETYLCHLMKFDRWCKRTHPDEMILTRELVHEWLGDEMASDCEITNWAQTMRQFGKYLAAGGQDAYILPDKYAPVKSRAVPYVFTDSELTALFAAIDALPATKNEPFLNEVAPVLFRLTYTCGLRPNEGRELLTENVNLETGEIRIIHIKRNKERIVVMSDDMLLLARKYVLRRSLFGSGRAYFFPSANNGPLKANLLYSAFNRAWMCAELPDRRVNTIRVYDLRHRFASACLNRWLDNGENLMTMLPFLREYMGHNSLSQTAYYVHVLPENILKSSAIDWEKFNSMFPEVML